jgi:hypothetical protein
MAIYRFRVSFEEYDDIHRDIEIRSDQTFEQFHLAIQESIGFDASKPASFFMSNDNWKKGQEIATKPASGENHSPALNMRECRMCDFIADPHQKIYYMFDAPSQWTFFVELFKILPDTDPSRKYPLCVKVHGDAPKQYVVVEAPKGIPDPEFAEDDLFAELIAEDGEEETAEDGESESGDDLTPGFGEEADEEEFDNIEESSEEEGEKD